MYFFLDNNDNVFGWNDQRQSHQNQKSIEIPTRDGSEVVEVDLDELPEDAEGICEILIAEEAPIELFKQFAVRALMN